MDQNEKMNFLAESIKQARKVMEKVENGKVTPTNNRVGMSESDVDRMLDQDTFLTEAPKRVIQQPNPNNVMRNLSKSKMPEAILKSFEALQNNTPTTTEVPTMIEDFGIEQKSIGTLGTTGLKFEPKDTVAQIHRGERVLSPEETAKYNSTGNQTMSNEKLDQLNNTMMRVAGLLDSALGVQTRTMKNVKSLGFDSYRGSPA